MASTQSHASGTYYYAPRDPRDQHGSVASSSHYVYGDPRLYMHPARPIMPGVATEVRPATPPRAAPAAAAASPFAAASAGPFSTPARPTVPERMLAAPLRRPTAPPRPAVAIPFALPATGAAAGAAAATPPSLLSRDVFSEIFSEKDSKFGGLDRFTDPEKMLGNLVMGVENPTIIIFGRGLFGPHTYQWKFDQPTRHIKVVHVDASAAGTLYKMDFNIREMRKKLFEHIRTNSDGTTNNNIMIQFDIDVFKFVSNIPEFLSDAKQALVKGGLLIFPFELAGGGISYSHTLDRDFTVALNHITLSTSMPYYIKDQAMTNALLLQRKKEAYESSMNVMMACLTDIFGNGQMPKIQPYPFFVGVDRVFFVSTA